MSLKFTVDQSGLGDFTDVTSAVELVKSGESAVIYIKNGVYKEKLVIDKPDITLIGEDKEKTIITYSDGAFMPDESGEPMGTFNTASVHILPSACGFEAYNLTIENGAGLGSVAGQAVALYLDCDKAVIKDCRLIAKQDTLLNGPMFADIEKNPNIRNRQFFKNCYIEGDVDFIFGGGTVVFEDCVIYALERPKELPCYLTAACTSDKLKYGYVFRNCHLSGNAEENSVFLGRPWREFANVVYIDCKMDKCISKKGFCKWNDTKRHLTSTYALYGCYGEGYDENKLVEWCNVLTDDKAQEYATDKVLEGWNYSVKNYEDLI